MNRNTSDALISFIRSVPDMACRCALPERRLGHHRDCMTPMLQEKADKLIEALESDETII